MTVRDFPDLIKAAPPLAPGDSVAKAVRRMRARGLSALPVAHGNQLVGLVQEADLAEFAASAADPARAAQARVEQVMRPLGSVVRDEQEIASALRALEPGAPSAPVVAGDGRLLGFVLRRDLLATVLGEGPTPPLAGLATPFGIYLTTGSARAGAGDLALGSTGVLLTLFNLVAGGLVLGLLQLVELLPGGLRTGMAAGSVLGLVLTYVLQLAVFLALVRLSPLASIHAAEHMVVHAVEEGEELSAEKVRAMPRVHPRCGTNLMALLILLAISVQFLSSVKKDAQLFVFFVLVLVVLLTWRRLGAGLQRWVTTRRPTDRQLERAIGVAAALLDKSRRRSYSGVSAPRRVWNAGFLQVILGFVAMTLLAEYAWPYLASAWTRLAG